MIGTEQVERAAFALMCAQTNWADGDGVKLDYWSRMNPAVKNQYHGWARTVLAALIQGDKEES
ncbi:hypothetical protein [Bifidobacterium pseudolongum]|uniref:Uncharacterized protein n=1 Tax=Bifidobacterium pseudolongum TaxID=1694 RepID=A0A395XFF0_9BIFI|nr:hypothetical protein [Bifidobacterium pseudolongum]RGW08620.1 hypothetical protein DWV92_07205 [Bifidobacterium pseudolongum]